MELTLIVGVVVSILTQLAKKASSFPLKEGHKGKIRLFAGILTLVGTALFKWQEGTLVDEGFLQYAGDSIVNYFVAAITYFSALRK